MWFEKWKNNIYGIYSDGFISYWGTEYSLINLKMLKVIILSILLLLYFS